jgi:hypothetical protein
MFELGKKKHYHSLLNQQIQFATYIARGHLDHSKIHLRNSGGAKKKIHNFWWRRDSSSSKFEVLVVAKWVCEKERGERSKISDV